MKPIKINGNEYTREELMQKPPEYLHIEVLVAIGKIQTHIETQDKANDSRFKIHEKLIIGTIFGLLASIAGIIISLIT